MGTYWLLSYSDEYGNRRYGYTTISSWAERADKLNTNADCKESANFGAQEGDSEYDEKRFEDLIKTDGRLLDENGDVVDGRKGFVTEGGKSIFIHARSTLRSAYKLLGYTAFLA